MDMWQFSPKYGQINMLLLDRWEGEVGEVTATPPPGEQSVQYLVFTDGKEPHHSGVGDTAQVYPLLIGLSGTGAQCCQWNSPRISSDSNSAGAVCSQLTDFIVLKVLLLCCHRVDSMHCGRCYEDSTTESRWCDHSKEMRFVCGARTRYGRPRRGMSRAGFSGCSTLGIPGLQLKKALQPKEWHNRKNNALGKQSASKDASRQPRNVYLLKTEWRSLYFVCVQLENRNTAHSSFNVNSL